MAISLFYGIWLRVKVRSSCLQLTNLIKSALIFHSSTLILTNWSQFITILLRFGNLTRSLKSLIISIALLEKFKDTSHVSL